MSIINTHIKSEKSRESQKMSEPLIVMISVIV